MRLLVLVKILWKAHSNGPGDVPKEARIGARETPLSCVYLDVKLYPESPREQLFLESYTLENETKWRGTRSPRHLWAWMLIAGTVAGELGYRWCIIPQSMIYVFSCTHIVVTMIPWPGMV